MKRVLDFGKIDYYGNGRNSNILKVELELKDVEIPQHNGTITRNPDAATIKEFSASATVWNMHQIVMGGQCINTVLEQFSDRLEELGLLKEYQTIADLWKKYHLNAMHAGTPEQEAALKDFPEKDYTKRCDYLKERGLYEVILPDGESYKYGHGWLAEEIPEEDLAKIEQIIEHGFEALHEIAKEEEPELDEQEMER